MNYEKKKVLVVGMARSGVAAAQLLRASGAEVTVNDSKTEEELGEILEKESGILSALFMSGWVYNDRIWWNAYAREIWATDSPSEDYGFDPEHPYLELDGYHIRELMNWRRP